MPSIITEQGRNGMAIGGKHVMQTRKSKLGQYTDLSQNRLTRGTLIALNGVKLF